MSSFTKAASIRATDAIVNSVWATPKAGKTTYVIGRKAINGAPRIGHWPLPIFVLNYDQGLAELLPFCEDHVQEQLFIKDLVAQTPFMNADTGRQMMEEAEDATRDALAAIKDAGKGTIAFDTATAHWQLTQLVDLEKIAKQRADQDKKLFPFDYSAANARWRNFVLQMKSTGCNIVMLHHAQEVYDGSGKPTGYYRAQDNSQQEKLTQVQMQLSKVKTPDGFTHQARIELCRLDTSLEGLTLPTNTVDYPNLYKAIYKRESPYV